MAMTIATNTINTIDTGAADRELVEELVHGSINFQQGARSPKDSCRKLLGMGQLHYRVVVAAHGSEDPRPVSR